MENWEALSVGLCGECRFAGYSCAEISATLCCKFGISAERVMWFPAWAPAKVIGGGGSDVLPELLRRPRDHSQQFSANWVVVQCDCLSISCDARYYPGHQAHARGLRSCT